MKFTTIIFSFFVFTLFAFRPSIKTEIAQKPIKAYIKKIGLDSISRQDLLKDNTILFTESDVKITMAVAYFDQGSFKNVLQQTFAGNKLTFLNLTGISKAATPYRITIADIRYVDSKGNKGMAEEFSFIVY